MAQNIGSKTRALGDYIRKHRRDRLMTATALLEALRLEPSTRVNSKSAISAWETGVQLPRPGNLEALSRILEAPLDTLVTMFNAAAEEKGVRTRFTASTLVESRVIEVEVEDLKAVITALEAVGPLPLNTVLDLLHARLRKK